MELYNIFKVFAAKKKKWETRASKLPEASPAPAPTVTPAPATTSP